MRNSLSTRLTYRIMAVVLVMMAIITSVVYFIVKKYMLDEAEQRYLGILLENHQDLRRRLSSVSIAVQNNIHEIERDIDNPDIMFGHMERIAGQNPEIACCFMLFKQNYYLENGRVFIPCARKDSTDSVRVTRIDSTNNSNIYGEWFQQQLEQDEGCWTKAYVESEFFAGDQEPRMLITYTAPIHDHEGRPVALLCADMSLEKLRDHLMEDIKTMNDKYEKNLLHQTYFFIVDHDGIFVMHPDKQRMTKNLDRMIGRMMKKHRGSCVTEVDGVKSWLHYRAIKGTDWVSVIVTPEEAILSNARMLNIIILLTMIAGLLAIYFLCRKQIKEIANPVAAEKASFERELKIANAIQMAMLPKASTLNSSPSAFDLYAKLTPAREVGGDLYDFFIRSNRLFFCIGDVSGKGVPAALMMMVVRAMFRGETRRNDSAAAIVETMSHNLSEENAAGYFVTMFVGILDLTIGLLDYCNAGHEAPLINGHPLDIERNLPVAALHGWSYKGQQVQLNPGDMLFLYTDGLSEAKNTEGKQLSRNRVLQLANEHASDTTQQLVETMESEVHHHVAEAVQSDDITMLAIRWEPSSYEEETDGQLTMRASMDDISHLEPFIANVARKTGIEEREGKRLRLAVEEAVANIINYGQANNITLQATSEDNQLVLTIDDDGQPFDPTMDSATDLSIPADQRPPGGLGIIFLHKMTDGLNYQRINNHNILTITKKRPISRSAQRDACPSKNSPHREDKE
ncbi:MAG: SpoIIE family protein phosphatase [Bacteroidaceae bacterium]|nr:SpoIIE family protein phosphatase [Bacteroidaceae bacterium]